MDRESPELIEREMEQTRESLTEKVSLLENKVVGQLQSATDTMQGALSSVQDTVETMKSSVQDTVETVKSAVQDTVQSVTETVKGSVQSLTDGLKEALDVRQQVNSHPIAMVGGAVAAGFVTGMLVFRRPASAATLPAYTPMPAASYATAAAAVPTRPSWLNDILGLVGQELKKVAEQAISRASASLRQTVEERVPHLIEQAIPGGHHGEADGAAGHFGNGPSATGMRR